jgi:hypothetical protein
LGKMAVVDVDRTDIDRFLHDVAAGKTAARIKTGRYGLARVSGGKGTATRTLELLGAIFTYAVRNRMRADNRCSVIVKCAAGGCWQVCDSPAPWSTRRRGRRQMRPARYYVRNAAAFGRGTIEQMGCPRWSGGIVDDDATRVEALVGA